MLENFGVVLGRGEKEGEGVRVKRPAAMDIVAVADGGRR